MSERLTYTGTDEDNTREWALIHARDSQFPGFTPAQRGAVNHSTTTCEVCGETTPVAARCHECGDWLNEFANPDLEEAKRATLAADALVAAAAAPVEPAEDGPGYGPVPGVEPADAHDIVMFAKDGPDYGPIPDLGSAPARPARTCATVATPSGVRPAGYVLGFDSEGFCGSAPLDTAAEVRELTEAIPVEGALYARAADYAVEPGTRLCVALYSSEGGLVVAGETVAEPGPRVPPYRVDLRYRVRTIDTTTTATPEV